MKKVFLFFASVLFAISIFAQEDKALLQRLKEKYGYASYNDMGDDDQCYVVGYSGNAGACDLNGKEIVPPKYDWASKHEGFYKTVKGDLYGVYSSDGREIMPPQWGAAVRTDAGYIMVYDGRVLDEGTKQGLYTLEGKMIFPCEYSYIDGVNSWDYKDAFLPQKDGYWGMTDRKGKFILKCEYSKIEIFDSLGIIITAKGGNSSKRGYMTPTPYHAKWGIATLKGKSLVPNEYDYIGKYNEGLFLCNKGGTMTDNEVEGGLWGYLDVKGNLVVPCQYESASKFEDGVAQVTLNGVSSLLINPLTGTNLQLANGGAATKVDANIPKTGRNADNTFAFIFANENYSHLSGADFSINDGKIFKEYCQKTIGIPEKNIRYFEDATFGNIVSAVQKIKDIADVYDGDAKIIFYYSGLGTSGKNKEGYILPIDASLDALNTTGYNVETLMQTLNALNTESTLVILDAPFSGTDKNGKMLAQHRGVQIAPKPVAVSGNTILCVSSNQTETAHSDKKYGHSLFTYALLEKLHSSKGSCTIKEAIDHATQWVKRESMSNYDKAQTPIVEVSEKKTTVWNHLKW